MQHKILNITRLSNKHYNTLQDFRLYITILSNTYRKISNSYYIIFNIHHNERTSQEIQYTKHDNTNHVKTAQHAAQKFKQ